MLKLYVAGGEVGEEIAPLIRIMESMAANPGNEALLVQLSDALGSLGIVQGAILTYAPYLSVILPPHDLLKSMD